MFYTWQKIDDIFKNGPTKICGHNLSKILPDISLQDFCKGFLPEILLSPFLNVVSQLWVCFYVICFMVFMKLFWRGKFPLLNEKLFVLRNKSMVSCSLSSFKITEKKFLEYV